MIDALKAGFMKVTGKGQLPEQPLIARAPANSVDPAIRFRDARFRDVRAARALLGGFPRCGDPTRAGCLGGDGIGTPGLSPGPRASAVKVKARYFTKEAETKIKEAETTPLSVLSLPSLCLLSALSLPSPLPGSRHGTSFPHRCVEGTLPYM